MKTFSSSLPQAFAVVVSGVLIFAAAFLVVQRLDTFLALRQKEMRNQAIDGCAMASKYVYTDVQGDGKTDTVTKTYEEPNQGDYQKCLELKNIQ